MGDLSYQIKELRRKTGLSQAEFAKKAGVGLRFLRELEQGKKTVRLDKLGLVLDTLGYHLEIRTNPSPEPPLEPVPAAPS